MMVLADIGNTNIKFAVCDGGVIVARWVLSTCSARTADEYFVLFSTLAAKAGIDITALREAAVSSVVPAVDPPIGQFFENCLGIRPIFISGINAELFDIKIRLAQTSIGADRLADLVAARKSWPGRDLLVIDMGTITVFNLLDKEGELYGQVLAPGISCLANSIKLGTALLPQVCIQKSEKAVCTSTIQSVEAGLYWGYRSMVEGLIKQIILENSGKVLHVVSTGGGSRILHGCSYIGSVDYLLTIKGILYIYERLKPPR